MEPEQDGAMRVLLGQLLAGMQEVANQQSQQLLHVLETRDTQSTSTKRSDVPWPTFSAEPKENVRLWLQKMEYAFRAHKIADGDRVVNAVLCLKGKASQWCMCLARSSGGDPFSDWSEFTRGITQRFEPANLQHQLRDQLREIKQDAAIGEYVGRFHELISQVDSMTEADQIAYFVAGLRPDLRYEIRRQRPATLADTIRLAEDTEDALRLDRPARVSARYDASPHTDPRTGPAAMEIDSLERRSRDAWFRPPVKCYNCQGFGHIARYCPSARQPRDQGRRPAPRQDRVCAKTLDAESGKESSQ
jgi:hypothetical protein